MLKLYTIRTKILGSALFVSAIAAGILITRERKIEHAPMDLISSQEHEENEEMQALFVRERINHEMEMLRDPSTGEIPKNIRSQELAFAQKIPTREGGLLSGPLGAMNLNTYLPAGPDNNGGRTRAVAYDKRFNGSTNKVIIAGGVSGGILRSSDAGLNWTKVSSETEINNLTALVQDPRTGQENTWYAGGGEALGNSAASAGAYYYGFGIYKSIDNGVTWTKTTMTYKDLLGASFGGGALEAFDHPFDITHRLVINPTNGDVYVCGHRRLLRSTDGGSTWNVVFAGTTGANSSTGQLDLVCSNTGKMVLAVNGGFPDANKRGVFTSSDGTTWTRIAGGSTLGVDSVNNWKGNSTDASGRRIVLAMAPSNQNILYITYDNGQSQSGSSGKPEADLFKLDLSGASPAWTNLSANVPDFTGQYDGVDPFAIQGGYDLMLAIKPDDPNTVFFGGVNLFRSTNGFSSTSATSWIGGYSNITSSTPYKLGWYGNISNAGDFSLWSHPDMHALVFNPSKPTEAICANDGGLQITDNIMGTVAGFEPVLWSNLDNYQTTQFYHVAIDPGSGRNNFLGGAQDNGTRFRDASGVLSTLPSGNSFYRLGSGDGGACAIAKAGASSQNIFLSSQYGNTYRATLTQTAPYASFTNVTPSGLTPAPGLSSEYGDFLTYYKIDFDNTDDLYYVNFNRLFRTTSSSTVTSGGWTELTGVGAAVNPSSPTNGTTISISTMELSRGPYINYHALFIGTSNSKVFRLNNPRNATATTTPIDITPPGLAGYVSDIAVNPNNDDEIMVVASNYGITSIFWTNNAKSTSPTWYAAEGNLNLPSIRTCMIAVKKDGSGNPVTEYYVGTSVGLYSAVNISTVLQSAGTLTWVREGGSMLGFSVINSLDYRPQDNTLLIGTHGNGMYYTQLGTANFVPNQNAPTGVNDPVINDQNFIRMAYPTVARSSVRYQIGNMYGVKNMTLAIYNMNGQTMMKKSTAYVSDAINIERLSKGAYVLAITSGDQKQRFLQKFIKE